MRINTTNPAKNDLCASLEKLSSGLRIGRSFGDKAGLVIARSVRAAIAGRDRSISPVSSVDESMDVLAKAINTLAAADVNHRAALPRNIEALLRAS